MTRKIIKGAVIACVIALLTYLEHEIPGYEYGQWTPMVLTGNSILINAAREYLKSKGYQV